MTPDGPEHDSSTRTVATGLHAHDYDALEHARFTPGQVFASRYRIISLLGHGAMGEVYRADDVKLGQPVALKFLPADFSREPSRIAGFTTEVRLAREITHPNVCRVYDIGESDGRHYLSMEYIDGEDLASLLRRIGRLPVEKVLDVVRELCAGLAAAHDKGVLHRDLKPANIMIDGRGRAHITDFGLAVTIEHRPTGEIAGTPAYMAPEQVVGGVVTEQTDLFSLGLILYELFTGIRVFNVASLKERRQTQQQAHSVVLSGMGRAIDVSLEALIVDCLQSDPVKRPASARAVASALPGGGDPLAAALAAGQVPSPAMVAAAGEPRGLRPKVAAIWLVVSLMGLLLVVWQIKGMMLYRQAPLAKPPDALIDRAQQIISKMGYIESPIDNAYWFASGRRYEDLARERSGGYEFVRRSREGGHDEVFFVYRQSPQYLVSENAFGVVMYREPPADVPGMADVTLDRLGRLVRFTGVPGSSALQSQTRRMSNWSVAFAEAGIDPGQFKLIQAAWTPPVKYDTLTMWEGIHPDRPTEVIQITAATWQGQPVLFDIEPDSAKSGAGSSKLGDRVLG